MPDFSDHVCFERVEEACRAEDWQVHLFFYGREAAIWAKIAQRLRIAQYLVSTTQCHSQREMSWILRGQQSCWLSSLACDILHCINTFNLLFCMFILLLVCLLFYVCFVWLFDCMIFFVCLLIKRCWTPSQTCGHEGQGRRAKLVNSFYFLMIFIHTLACSVL